MTRKEEMMEIDGKHCLHNALRIPEDRIGVKVSSGVKPEVKLLLFVTFAICEYIGMQSVRVAT